MIARWWWVALCFPAWPGCGGEQTAPASTPTATASPVAAMPTASTSADPIAPATAAAPPGPPPPPKQPFWAGGTFRGAPVHLDCSNPSTEPDALGFRQAAGNAVTISCSAPSLAEVTLTVASPSVGTVTLPDKTQGSQIRIASKGETVTTTGAGNGGTLTITRWDVPSRLFMGTFQMAWPKDSSGKSGTLSGEFCITGATPK
jgi:hypothetical protein